MLSAPTEKKYLFYYPHVLRDLESPVGGILKKEVKFVGGGSFINGAYPF